MSLLLIEDETRAPHVVIGENELRKVMVAALIDVARSSEGTDFLLYELDRAEVVPDALLPADVIRLGSVVSYEATSGDLRTVKLVMPVDTHPQATYRLSVTSEHGAALLGLSPGAVMTWLTPAGERHRIRVIAVANPTD